LNIYRISANILGENKHFHACAINAGNIGTPRKDGLLLFTERNKREREREERREYAQDAKP
jgi:hypothetical protein